MHREDVNREAAVTAMQKILDEALSELSRTVYADEIRLVHGALERVPPLADGHQEPTEFDWETVIAHLRVAVFDWEDFRRPLDAANTEAARLMIEALERLPALVALARKNFPQTVQYLGELTTLNRRLRARLSVPAYSDG